MLVELVTLLCVYFVTGFVIVESCFPIVWTQLIFLSPGVNLNAMRAELGIARPKSPRYYPVLRILVPHPRSLICVRKFNRQKLNESFIFLFALPLKIAKDLKKWISKKYASQRYVYLLTVALGILVRNKFAVTWQEVLSDNLFTWHHVKWTAEHKEQKVQVMCDPKHFTVIFPSYGWFVRYIFLTWNYLSWCKIYLVDWSTRNTFTWQVLS